MHDEISKISEELRSNSFLDKQQRLKLMFNLDHGKGKRKKDKKKKKKK